ncbi:MAG TPA: sialate O-acetylesterase [Chitinophaga sp.]|uniref:sialate O-acetylesterase n=1 Tax=Chitinophaga sp. TaxID=1869181 RepID=UPI002DBC08DB|nr:sialate O-acetylesterase [Chitinophaga sp.]HEU4555478.1 sialate O-acetylesterase [Chitinophaga sp.]
MTQQPLPGLCTTHPLRHFILKQSRRPACCRWLLLAAALLFCNQALYSQLKLPRLVRDSMVLQRDVPLHLWGWAQGGKKVSLLFNSRHYSARANADGKWTITLPPQQAGGPYSMTITAGNSITLHNILIGDVWFCSGQSNMVLPMERVKEKYPAVIAGANYPAIRHFFIPTLTNLVQPEDDLPTGYWKSATPADVLQFSATAYFFALDLYQKYHVPIGLINASVGGTPIEAWMSEDALQKFPALYNKLQQNQDTAAINTVNRRETALAAAMHEQQQQMDAGLTAATPWYDTAYRPKGWRSINIPGYWEDQGLKALDGIVWYRKTVDVPASVAGKPAKLFMGRIIDADYLYVNGVPAGNITYQYPPRRYTLKAGLLKPGKNIITIRVINYRGKGGFVPDKPYYIQAGDTMLDLKGEWQYKVGEVFMPGSDTDNAITLQYQPASLFNAMVAPVAGYSIKGILWYQGEANAGAPAEYDKLLPALINNWRNKWQQPDIPFLYVQLPNYMDRQFLPSESNWAILRNAQLKALSVPNTAMAVTIDLGEWNDIHPLNKKDVGHRLALAAEKTAYHENGIVYAGPVYQSCKAAGNKVAIRFSHTGSGLVSCDGEPLQQFAIAGPDKKFVWAQAVIEDDKVIVWNSAVTDPKYVRYAWADNPAGANLYNKEGLPASPFECAVGEDR